MNPVPFAEGFIFPSAWFRSAPAFLSRMVFRLWPTPIRPGNIAPAHTYVFPRPPFGGGGVRRGGGGGGGGGGGETGGERGERGGGGGMRKSVDTLFLAFYPVATLST